MSFKPPTNPLPIADIASSAAPVSIVGAGPGDSGLLTVRALEALRRADVLLYDALVPSAIVALAPSRCDRIFVGKRRGDHAMEQRSIEELMIEHARAGRRVVRLKGGDPFVFGRGGEEAQALARAGVPFEIVPGITSAIAAPAYAGIPLTHRAYNAAFTVATGHEDPEKNDSPVHWDRLADPHQTLVLLMAAQNLEQIAAKLVEGGMPPSHPAAVIADGTLPTQRTVTGTLATIATQAREAGIGAPAVAVFGEVVALRDDIRWFDRGPLFGKRVLVTRPADQSGEFAQRLREAGAEPVLAPAIALERPEDPSQIERGVNAALSSDWVVFTSANGVSVFFVELQRQGRDARALATARVAAIGPITAAALRANGIVADLVPQRYFGEALGDELAASVEAGSSIVLFRAQEAGAVLPDRLRDRYRLHEFAAYKTVFVDDPAFLQKAASCDAVTFTSPSTVAGFVHLSGGAQAAVSLANAKVVACIGPVTAQAARALGVRIDVVADRYTSEDLLCALESAFSSPAR